MNAILSLRDSHGRTIKKRVECEATTIAQALLDLADYVDALTDVSDLGLDAISLQARDTSMAYEPGAGSNVDVGGHVKGITDDGYGVSLAIPGIKSSLVDSSGSIDITAEVMVTYLNLFKAAGAFRISRGNTVTSWISGKLDR
jgi:hypothetical protein